MRIPFLLACVCLCSWQINAQEGCTDPQANNFDSAAVDNDGSCAYSPTSQDLNFLYVLSEANPNMSENSGIDISNEGEIMNINDGGNPAVILVTSAETGWLEATIELTGAENVDWEEIAVTDDKIFVGDFGNNSNGARTDQRIYCIDRDSLNDEAWQTVTAMEIAFYFPEQGQAIPVDLDQTPWDCEAMFFKDDEIHIFTKDWQTYTTKHYKLPVEEGYHAAQLVEEFDCQGLITAADINDERIVLLGYTIISTVFMYVLWDYEPGLFFSGNKRRIELGFAVDHGQTEGIAFSSELGGYISSERFIFANIINEPPQLLTFTIEDYMTSVTSIPEGEIPKFWPTVSDGSFNHDLPSGTLVSLFDTRGRLVFETNVYTRMTDFNVTGSGVYHACFLYKGQKYSQKLIIQ
jgi:hypothetical protein